MVVTTTTRKKTFTMSLSTLTQFDRGAIYHLRSLGLGNNQIAKRLGVSKSTISYELNRVTPYDPVKAQLDADSKRAKCGRKATLTNNLSYLISNHLKLSWSPEQIAHKFSLNTKSIYNWIYRGWLAFEVANLPDRGRRRKRKEETRGSYPTGTSIEERPEAINNRTEFGDWEIDTVLSSKGESKACLATFTERKTRFTWIKKIDNRPSKSMNEAISDFIKLFGPSVKSLTSDHGKEFAGYKEIQDKYSVDFYFCHPYSPWERGSNEYFNRKIRWFYPRKTNFSKVTEDSILETIELINSRPLKVLGHKAAIEAFYEFYSRCSD